LLAPPALDIVDVQGTKSLKEAGKTLVYEKGKCIIYGLNVTAIPSGPIAIAQFKVGPDATGKAASSDSRRPRGFR